jgi:hypothetical protein
MQKDRDPQLSRLVGPHELAVLDHGGNAPLLVAELLSQEMVAVARVNDGLTPPQLNRLLGMVGPETSVPLNQATARDRSGGEVDHRNCPARAIRPRQALPGKHL